MIVYTGNPTTLYVERRLFDGDGRLLSAMALLPRLTIVNHSLTGFAWGYWGSGPAQLSFALIADALVSRIEEKYPELRASTLNRAANPSLYQEFKQRVVGTWSQVDPWTFTDEQVLRHVAEIERDLDLRGAELGTDAGSAR